MPAPSISRHCYDYGKLPVRLSDVQNLYDLTHRSYTQPGYGSFVLAHGFQLRFKASSRDFRLMASLYGTRRYDGLTHNHLVSRYEETPA